MCCKLLDIDAVETKAGEWCQHCDIGNGCAIYKDRPADCRQFKCLWLEGYGDESERPDKSKVVAFINRYTDNKQRFMLISVDRAGADDAAWVQSLKERSLKNGFDVVVQQHGDKHTIIRSNAPTRSE